jgi:ubiquinone/menaquinone biosynthesis C-methylase UbiE
MPRDEFDAYRDTYVETVEQSINFSGLSHDFFQHSKALMIKDILAKRMARHPSRRLLDVGCGVGALHPYIAPMFDLVHGVDVSYDSIDRARQDNPSLRYDSYDGERLPFTDNSFDMTLAICVMHHVPTKKWTNFMSEMARVVTPGGLVCLIEHNPINPATRLSVARCPFDADAVLLGARQMRMRMRAAHLQDVASRHFVFFPSNKPVARAMERKLHWLPLGAQYAAMGQVT